VACVAHIFTCLLEVFDMTQKGKANAGTRKNGMPEHPGKRRPLLPVGGVMAGGAGERPWRHDNTGKMRNNKEYHGATD